MKHSEKYVDRMDSKIQSCKCKKDMVTTMDIVIDTSSKSSTGFTVCYKCAICNASGKKYEFPISAQNKYKRVL